MRERGGGEGEGGEGGRKGERETEEKEKKETERMKGKGGKYNVCVKEEESRPHTSWAGSDLCMRTISLLQVRS